MNLGIALCVIYNHKYENNIQKINNIYSCRFSNIYHLMPFYDGDMTNVIPVYCGSSCFEGFVTAAYQSLKDKKYCYVVFIADDLLLHPDINETTIIDKLNIGKSGYITKSVSLHKYNLFSWRHYSKAILCINSLCAINQRKYIQWEKEIPTCDEMIDIFNNKHKLDVDVCLTINNISSIDTKILPEEFCLRQLLETVEMSIKENGKYMLKYPLLRGYSDFFIVHGDAFKKFSHYCGIFSAIGLWVEVAIPTAINLSHENMTYEERFKGKAIWSIEEIRKLQVDNAGALSNVDKYIKSNDFLFLHPVKLTQWS